MGLEAATYVSDFDVSNPLAADRKNQGDDHLRLIKQVLKNSFPGLSHASRFPATVVVNATGAIPETYDNAFVLVVTGGSSIAITLPTPTYQGWHVTIMKSRAGDTNPVYVIPPGGGTIQTAVGFLSQVRISPYYEAQTFFWDGNFIRAEPLHAPRPGMIQICAEPTLPSGHLLMDGTSLLRADYPELFAVWGVTHGAADGSHFTVPNLIDRFPAFSGTVGQIGGEASHTLTVAEMPIHNHGITQTPHDHGITTTTGVSPSTIITAGGVAGVPPGNPQYGSFGSQVDVSPANADISINNAGSGNAHENRPPYFTLFPITKAC